MTIVTVTLEDSRLIQEIADGIACSKRAVVITGAGISTNCGIPDFRSEEGLYNLVKSRYPDIVVKGKDLFDSVVFGNPASIKVFYTFIAQLRDSILAVKETSPTHKFIRALCENGRLLRCYTQNIDGLEEREGMTTNLALGKGKRKRPSAENSDLPNTEEEKGCQVVQLHGDLNQLRCMQCQTLCKYDKVKVETLRDGAAPDCPHCVGMDKTRRQSGKRGTRIGSLRPNIVLYGEEHPLAEKIGTLTAADLRSNPDYLIILGTSLRVHGLKTIVKAMAQAVHARKGKVIYVNNTAASFSLWKDVIDFHVEMDCDQFVKLMKGNRPEIWMKQTKVDKLMKLAIMKNTPEDKENLATRPKAKAKGAGARNPLIQKMANGEAQKKRKAGDIGGTIKDRPTPVKKNKAGLKNGCKKPAKVNNTKPAKSNVIKSAKESEYGGRPTKRLKITGPVRKSKGNPKDTKASGSTMAKAKSPTVKDTKSSKSKGSVSSLVAKDTKIAKGLSSNKTKNTRSNTEDTEAGPDIPGRRLGLKGVFVGPKEPAGDSEEGSSPTNSCKRSEPQISKADPKETKVQCSIKVQAEAPAVGDTKIAPSTPSKRTPGAGPYTRSTGLSTRSTKVVECAPVTDLRDEASRAEVKGSPGAENKISCQPSPPATSGSRMEKRCPPDPSFLAGFDLPSVPSTPSRSLRSKLDNMLPSVRLNTPERSCSPPEFAVEMVSPRKGYHFLDRVKALKRESVENLAIQEPHLRRSTRARRNTIL
ncbi:DHS-like NAD/FAD-binding domain-containing protein [Choiromyces venosus 120613-1]|uniref:DHS-like NAD/FAD-binding domain-containing protein n=1 Tax=Choiromyces venosus 120613-1 TaxID=1336337 RepID=A0A3N4J750_9PEZI|nr:DHS-like NAD/FAD-binding domain-containing protein [Choiromyces venosus 120613-1]